MQPDWNTTYAWGRRQPYDGRISWQDPNHYQQAPQAGVQPPMGTFGNSFNRHNGRAANNYPAANSQNETLEQPFRPLLHLDRIVLNPAELLHVTAVKPSELTHSFQINQGSSRWEHTANWLDDPRPPTNPQGGNGVAQPSYLWRALQFLNAEVNVDGVGIGGRVPGKVNINTVFAKEVFEAVCDLQGGNRFAQTDIDRAWTKLITDPTSGRTPGMVNPNNWGIGLTDQPYWGNATAAMIAPVPPFTPATALMDRNRTIIREGALWNNQPNLEDYSTQLNQAGALQRYELMSKVFNQFTTRSNCFAVYMTVGYFEVRNPGPYNEANRPILGKEMGTDDGTVTRHRFFSVIDRTNLSIEQQTPPFTAKQGAAPVYFTYQPMPPPPQPPANVSPDPQTATLASVDVRIPVYGQDSATSVFGYYDGNLWEIQGGANPATAPQSLAARFMLDIGANQEEVYVQSIVNYDQFSGSATLRVMPLTGGNFLRAHYRGACLRLRSCDPTNARVLCDPGNPGPQPGFNFKSPRYAAVVKYVEQMK